MERTIVERCALSGSDLKIKFRTILLTSIRRGILYFVVEAGTVGVNHTEDNGYGEYCSCGGV